MTPEQAEAKARELYWKHVELVARRVACDCQDNIDPEDVAVMMYLAAAAEEREHEWICDRCGIRVEPHRCQNEATF